MSDDLVNRLRDSRYDGQLMMRAEAADHIERLEALVKITIPRRGWDIGDLVKKTSGSEWRGRVVGFYSTDLTPIGYCIESSFEKNSVQIFPEKALERWDGQ